MKICSKCKVEKQFEDFTEIKNGTHVWCKPCLKEYNRLRHLTYAPKRRQLAIKRLKSLREFVNNLKSSPCVDCGNSYHPIAMQYDHTKTNKKYNVSDLVKNGFSIENILKEIAKCDLVCANCHAVRTYKRNLV